jgi:Cytochrome c oxidase subunit III
LASAFEILHAPAALGGVIIASLVATPEAIGAVRSAISNQLQRAMNIFLGSVLSTIGLSIPIMLVVSHLTERQIYLGFTCGLCALASERRNNAATYLWGAITFFIGASFIALELSEFARLVAAGAAPTRSAFLSAFFCLVGTHGLHATLGLGWLLLMMAQVATLGFRPMIVCRLFCFTLFWHALDIVWNGVFTIVYLGAR